MGPTVNSVFIPNWWCWRCIHRNLLVLFHWKIDYWLIWFVSLPISVHFNFHGNEKFALWWTLDASVNISNWTDDRSFESDRSLWKAILSCLVRVINNPIVNYNRQQWQSAKLFPWTYECLLLLIVSFCLQHGKWQPAHFIYSCDAHKTLSISRWKIHYSVR